MAELMWKTIDSAPKDGTRMLLLATAVIGGGNEPEPVVGRYTEDRWRTAPITSGLRWEEFDLRPSHWTAIPKRP
jgi:hypothetical protein